MKRSLLSLALFAGLGLAAPASAQQFVPIPSGSYVIDMTPDGSIVVGNGAGGGFYWRWRTDPAPTFIGGNEVTGVSDDGSVLVGCIDDPITGDEVAGRWTAATGWQSLGFLPNALSCPSRSNAYDVSGDGETVVGLSWDGCNGRAFLWTQATGMQELQVLANQRNRATTISGDGTTIAGFGQGNVSRTPAYWADDLTGSIIDIDSVGEVYGLTEDGGLSVGIFEGSAFYRPAGGLITEIGTLNAGWSGNAYDVSEDGDTIVGFDNQQFSREAWIWHSADGIVSVQDRLAALGLTVPTVLTALACSDDGRVVAGAYDDGSFFGGAYVADLTEAPWTNLGGGTYGANGWPQLKGDGPLTAGSPATLSLTNAPSNAIMLAWLSFASVPLPAFGGLIHANPFANQFFFFADAQGEWSATVPWPAGVPSGTDVYFQFIVEDVSTLFTLTLTNGVQATTP